MKTPYIFLLFIVIFLTNTLLTASPATDYTFIREFGEEGTISESNKFIAMDSIAVDRFGHVFVTDVYEPESGADIRNITANGTVFGNQSVKRWTIGGQFERFWENTDIFGGHQFGPARGIDCHCDGDPFYCAPYEEWYGANIEHSSPAGDFREEFPPIFWNYGYEFIFRDVAVGADGCVYGIAYRQDIGALGYGASVVKFKWTGTNWIDIIERKITNEFGFSAQPWGIDADTWRHRVYVTLLTTNGTAGVKVYDTDLKYINTMRLWDYPAQPKGIAVDNRDGTFLVSEAARNMIYKFAPDGSPLMSFGETGTAPYQFNNPKDLDVDMNGWLYVADAGNYRVQVFAPPLAGNLNFIVYKSKVKVGWKQKTKGKDRDILMCKAWAALDIYTNITSMTGMPFSFWCNELPVIPEMPPTKTNKKGNKALYMPDKNHKAKVQYRTEGAQVRLTVKLKRGDIDEPLNITDTTPLPPWLWITAQMTLSNEYLGVHYMRLEHRNKVGKVYKAWKK